MPKSILRYTSDEAINILKREAEKVVGHECGEVSLRVNIEVTPDGTQIPRFYGVDIYTEKDNECKKESYSDPT